MHIHHGDEGVLRLLHSLIISACPSLLYSFLFFFNFSFNPPQSYLGINISDQTFSLVRPFTHPPLPCLSLSLFNKNGGHIFFVCVCTVYQCAWVLLILACKGEMQMKRATEWYQLSWMQAMFDSLTVLLLTTACEHALVLYLCTLSGEWGTGLSWHSSTKTSCVSDQPDLTTVNKCVCLYKKYTGFCVLARSSWLISLSPESSSNKSLYTGNGEKRSSF